MGGLLMAAGLTLALTCGLCSVVFAGVTIVAMTTPNGDPGALEITIAFIIAGFLVAAFGYWLFRRGLARVRED